MAEFNEMKVRTEMKKNKWSWYKFPKVLQLYMYLLREAITENEPYGEIMLCRGDVIHSLKTISAESGLGITAIRTALRYLMSTHDVECITYGHSRIIHINSYNLFMGRAEEPEEALRLDTVEPEYDDIHAEEPEFVEAGSEEQAYSGICAEEPEYAAASPAHWIEELAEESGRKQETDTKLKRSAQAEGMEMKSGSNVGENMTTTVMNDVRKAEANRRILPGAMGGYRGAYYSGVTRVCENTESLVTLSNPEKEIESKTIYNTHSLHTHSVTPDSLTSREYPAPAGIHTGTSGVSELFEKFWEAYPRHVNRYLAKRAFEQLNPDAETLAEILKALSRQKESQAWHVEEGRYIPYPARWLSEHRWEDDPAESERKFRTRQESAPKYTVPAQNYEQRDYSEEMETPEEMLARLRRGVGYRNEAS